MRTFRVRITLALGLFLLCAVAVTTRGHTQDGAAANADCPEVTQYSEAYSLVIANIDNCWEIVEKIETAAETFLEGECSVLEARIYAKRTANYTMANQLITLARSRLDKASALFLDVSGQIDKPLPSGQSNEIEEAFQILAFYQQSRPQTYGDAFKILGEGMALASSNLADIVIADGNATFAKRSMYQAMIRPGAIFRAIGILFDRPAA